MDCESLYIGILANAIFGVGSFLLYIFFVRMQNQSLLEFWNLGDERTLFVYLSRLEVLIGGSTGAADDPSEETAPGALDESNSEDRRSGLSNAEKWSSTGSPTAYQNRVIPSGQPYSPPQVEDHELNAAYESRGKTIKDASALEMVVDLLKQPGLEKKKPAGIARNYQGEAVPKLEHDIADDLRWKFYSPVGDRVGAASLTSGLLRAHALAEVKVSPETLEEIEPVGTIVTFGSPGYNQASKKIEQLTGGAVEFIEKNCAIRLPGHELVLRDYRHGVIVRYMAENRCWFYAAGMTSLGTAAAAYFLIHSWEQLERIRRNSESFWVAIESDPVTYKYANVIAEGLLPYPQRRNL